MEDWKDKRKATALRFPPAYLPIASKGRALCLSYLVQERNVLDLASVAAGILELSILLFEFSPEGGQSIHRFNSVCCVCPLKQGQAVLKIRFKNLFSVASVNRYHKIGICAVEPIEYCAYNRLTIN